MQRRWPMLPLTLLAAGIAACSSAPETPAPATTTNTTIATAPKTPPYELLENGRQLTALVRTDDTELLRLVYREISGRTIGTRPAGGYFLNIDCAINNEPGKAANRLATAKIAVGTLGAAQTGLGPGKSTIDFNTGRTCREGATPTTFDRARVLDRDYAVELCRGRIEEKYVADQRPVKMFDVNVTEAGGTWTVTGVAQGKSNGGTEKAKNAFQCSAVNDGVLRSELVKFSAIR